MDKKKFVYTAAAFAVVLAGAHGIDYLVGRSHSGTADAVASQGQGQTYEVAMCPEPVRISDCKIASPIPILECVVENTAQVALRADLQAWGYGRDGVLLGNAYVLVSGLLPGQKKRVQMPFGTQSPDVATAVVCSMDPESPIMKNQLVRVGQAK